MSKKEYAHYRAWMVTVQVANMIKAGLSEEEYSNPEFVAKHFLKLWENSGKDRTAAVAVCMSAEGLYHLHMAVYGNATTLKRVAEILFDSHVEPQRGGKKELTAYLLKEGKYAEKGEVVLYALGIECIQDNQGYRNDLSLISEYIEAGYTANEILDMNILYRRYAPLIKDAYMSHVLKTMPHKKKMWNEYHFGPSGSGKTNVSVKLIEAFGDESVYICDDYENGGMDFYKDTLSPILFLDEFRGIPYTRLLSILDIYTRKQQHARYQNIYNTWKSVIISSILAPEEAYAEMVDASKRGQEPFTQMMRRLNMIVYHFERDGKYYTYSVYACDYTNKRDLISNLEKDWADGNDIPFTETTVDLVRPAVENMTEEDFLNYLKDSMDKDNS